MNTQADLIDWLRDAFAMEKAMETALQKLVQHPQTQTALREQAAQHCAATSQHAEAVAVCLKQLGSDTSSLKTVLAQGMDLRKTAGAAFARDERIQDVLTVFVTEHFEISCHTILRTGAAQLGHWEIVGICDEILFEEKRMARWLQSNMPQIIAAYLAGPEVAPDPDEEEDPDEEPEEDLADFALADFTFTEFEDSESRWKTFRQAKPQRTHLVAQPRRQHSLQSI